MQRRLSIGQPPFCRWRIHLFENGQHNLFAIKIGGRYKPCTIRVEAGHTYSTNNGDVFPSAWVQLKELCKPIQLCPECVDCPDQRSCMNCAAVTFAETGRFDGKPEYMCQLNRSYRDAITKLAKTLGDL